MIPIEDHTGDVISKAQRGLGLTNAMLMEKAGITQAQLRALKSGEFNEEALRRVAPVLKLDADALVELGRGSWYPQQPGEIDGFRMFTTPYGSMTVNACLVWDKESRKAVVFDTGADARPILKAAEELGVSIELILITHAHEDHVADLKRLLAKTGAKAYVNVREQAEEDFPKGVETFSAGQSFVLGRLRIESVLTSGHSPGQTTYIVKGLERLVAVVGDSLFAGSIGGGLVSFADQYRNDRERILTLPDDTVIAPGHGPLTTVGEEKAHNPFFARS
ncbi:MAG: MBL fold metallo-hydrolase [Verrucomicrobia bacterium]|nr:MAG: MBL fold metallo-hydrolase [Verrucomicrobiota bacterium]